MEVERYTRWVLRRRAVVVMACAIISVLSTAALTRATFATSLVGAFLGDSPAYHRDRELARRFGDGDRIVVAYEDAALFAETGWRRLREAVAQIEALPFVRRVTALPGALDAIQAAGGLDGRGPDPHRALGPRTLREVGLSNPEVRSHLVSPDGCCTAVLIEVMPYDRVPVEELSAWLEALQAPFLQRGLPREGLHVAGLIPESVEAMAQTRQSLRGILPATAAALLLVVFALFRQVWPVVISHGVALMAMLWTSAFAVLVEPRINVMMAMVPAVVLVVAFSDGIHLFSSYLQELRAGRTREEAILRSSGEVGRACVYTSATTGVGFLSMALVPAPVFRHLALVMAVGVALALWLSLTLVPVFLSWMRVPAFEGQKAGGMVRGLTVAAAALSRRHPRAIVAAAGVIAAVSLLGVGRMDIELSMLNRLRPDHPLRAAQRFMAAHFAGTTFLDVYLTAGRGELLEPGRLGAIETLQRDIASLPGVDRVWSVADLLARLPRKPGDGRPAVTTEELSHALERYATAGGRDREPLIDPERRTMRLMVRLAGSGVRHAAVTGDRIAALAERRLGGVEIVPGGLAYVVGGWLGEIVAGQKRGLLLALLVTTVLIVACLRRVGAGLVSLAPNALPLLVLGGTAGWVWGEVDADILLVAMIAVGIAVDDTIHFLTRFEIESRRAPSVDRALDRTFAHVGCAMIQTTLILCAGLLPFAASGHATTRLIGALLPLTLLVALVADLLLLPAFVRLGLLRMPRVGQGPDRR